ncbi:MAG: glycosyltransferase family 9 protein [Ignavibacteriaceae bacterium]|jgi:ADP-heptose:LPS heptosyltransferase|nr:glycosyltransferase family 9 protein [Ignavibacteriaceae bacterium]MCW8996984.1 glycosyltransferase family 9 protein [Psychromonas sp.]MCW9094627.1 glycosyltransferase family 9 protein [Ignavibacteriaceae bacterium]MCW9098212.1 glycosyltransferase family 9 protein [Ignavibacteriaceae bacterium]
MKFKSQKIPFNEFLNRIKVVGLLIHTILYFIFFVIRQINKLFSFDDGNVIIIALHRLGDTTFTIHAIRKIVEQYGSKTIIVCFSESVPIYKLVFRDIEFCTVERRDFYFQERIAKKNVKQKLKALNPFVIFDLTGSMISAALLFKMKAKKIIGINGKAFRGIYDNYVKIREIPRLTDIYLDAISPLIQVNDKYELNKPPIAINPNGKILVHPFARLKEKEWGLRKFFSLAEKLNVDYDVSIVAQMNNIDFDIRQEIINSKITVIQTNSSEDLIQRISECSLFIGNDSGPVNIANFLGKPTFTIYGSTNPAYTAPNSDHQIYAQKVLKCSARQNEKLCLAAGEIYCCPGIQCMNQLTEEEIFEYIIPLARKYCSMRT